jgi:PelA/Pel-15E family pectate lyase
MSHGLTNTRWVFPVWLLAFASVSGAIIGTNVPARPLTLQRIGALPAASQVEWQDYYERSARQRRVDHLFLQKEMGERGLKESIVPPSSRGIGSMPLGRSPGWYATGDALRIARIIVSFQTPAGGWSKNLDVADHVRQIGEGFAPENSARFIGPGDNDALEDLRWSYVGTIDNGATTGELRFLARVITALPAEESAAYRAAFVRGVEYLLAAQFPNGGWPQVWPLQGGYHDSITYNDGAMLNVLELLQEVAAGKGDFNFVPTALRQRAEAAVKRGVECILATQIVVDGRRTVWCQQHDALTLAAAAARNYEMPSLCSAESAGIMGFLMRLPAPGSNVVAAVQAAAGWLEQTRMQDVAYRNVGDRGRLLVAAPGSGPLWARYYEIGTNRPIFGERDKTIHDRVDDISRERRQGYAWFTDGPAEALKRFAKWNEAQIVRRTAP